MADVRIQNMICNWMLNNQWHIYLYKKIYSHQGRNHIQGHIFLRKNNPFFGRYLWLIWKQYFLVEFDMRSCFTSTVDKSCTPLYLSIRSKCDGTKVRKVKPNTLRIKRKCTHTNRATAAHRTRCCTHRTALHTESYEVTKTSIKSYYPIYAGDSLTMDKELVKNLSNLY